MSDWEYYGFRIWSRTELKQFWLQFSCSSILAFLIQLCMFCSLFFAFLEGFVKSLVVLGAVPRANIWWLNTNFFNKTQLFAVRLPDCCLHHWIFIGISGFCAWLLDEVAVVVGIYVFVGGRWWRCSGVRRQWPTTILLINYHKACLLIRLIPNNININFNIPRWNHRGKLLLSKITLL